jgi:sigma-B regulation protein RsbU (phosphoserine phosphatase)
MAIAAPPQEFQSIFRLREEELDEARTIQRVMQPSQPFRMAKVTISHEFQPAAAVGGDYLDYFSMSDGTIGLYVGDVSGKGLPAALFAALAVGTLRGIEKTGKHPSRVLHLLNERLLLRGIPGRHTAIQYATFDPATAEMNIVSAGMPGPFLLRGSELEVLELAGIPPGLFPDITYDVLKVQLKPGDSILFFTDGLTDARNIHEEDFDLEGMKKVCRQHAGESRVELLGHIFRAIEEFSADCHQFDDMTAAVFHYDHSE